MRNIIKVLQRHDKGKKFVESFCSFPLRGHCSPLFRVSFGNDAVKTFIYEKESEEATPILQRQSFTEFVCLLFFLGSQASARVLCTLCFNLPDECDAPFKRLGALPAKNSRRTECDCGSALSQILDFSKGGDFSWSPTTQDCFEH